ncbi:beta-glucuronidase [Thermoanaerobacterium sp. R66]|uniref:beta-glucuronidase n=1 Tax=Thermoanaerobacterium sp. R66 TaxID=2742479 RepID=UPI00238009EF|nr:beta-glucuronidase [Thermoanaerobacterium sp. R66]MDE4542473.1 beta-glucuronidase [Thermoanaerobacterium sp. R66]
MLYPKLNSARMLIDLSGIWDFKADDGNGFSDKWYERKLENPLTIAVPASYNDQKESIDLRDHYGYVFYQREVAVPKYLKGQRIVLRFGAVTHYAKVYLNGELICEHKGGFLPFEVEIQDIIKFDESNLLTVAVDNRIDYSSLPVGNENGGNILGGGLLPSVPGVTPKKQNAPNFDFFNYAGIHRPVKIYTTPLKYIKDVTIVPNVDGNDAKVVYSVETVGDGDVLLTIYDENNEIVAKANGKEGTFIIKNVKLWQPLNAYLYTAKITFGEDMYEQTFGVRTVEVKGNQFYINGKPFYFKGFGKHEDSNVHGRGIDEVLNVKDISLMKWMGANSFRTSHYPYSEEMMNLCDREGIVVIDETPAVGVNLNFGGVGSSKQVDTFKTIRTHEHHRKVIKDMIERDKNHPCVVMWSLANESDTMTIPDSAYEYYKPLYELAHKCDPQNRPVTIVGVQGDYTKDKTLPAMDVICINRYYGWYIYGGDLDAAKQALTLELEYWQKVGKPVIFTEFGADTIAGLHLATPNMFTEEYQVDFLKANVEVFDKFECVVGEQVWNFADFQTIQGIMRVDGNKKGVFTRDRRPKLAAHYLRNRWLSLPDFDYKF